MDARVHKKLRVLWVQCTATTLADVVRMPCSMFNYFDKGKASNIKAVGGPLSSAAKLTVQARHNTFCANNYLQTYYATSRMGYPTFQTIKLFLQGSFYSVGSMFRRCASEGPHYQHTQPESVSTNSKARVVLPIGLVRADRGT